MNVIMTLLALLFSIQVSATSLNKIVVFGDSLSDNGNLYEYMKHELPLSPPYFQGRFTNGPVWVELLADAYYPKDGPAHLLDYAFGGAGVSEEVDDDDDEEVLFTLRREVDSYLLSHQDQADASSLYIVWMGSNNYLGVPTDEEQAVAAVVLGIRHDVERLVKKGAQHIMVVNVSDLGRTPAAKDFDAVDALTSLSNKHNQRLKENMAELRQLYPDVQWLYFDVNQVLDDLLMSPEQYGFTNITDTCYEEMVDNPSGRSILTMVSTVKSRRAVDACTGYLFFDPVHPTAPAHQIMVERTKKMLDEAGITFE
ncbi:MAG TPA: lysophospholipase [Legionella sp.]|nr:lysophospholipase [Legionella sp.]